MHLRIPVRGPRRATSLTYHFLSVSQIDIRKNLDYFLDSKIGSIWSKVANLLGSL
jgi:hypothetical protein